MNSTAPVPRRGAESASGDAARRGGYCVGIVHHRSYSDLVACIESVKEQTRSAAAVGVVDVDPDPAQAEALRARYPEWQWESMQNRGYAAGANRLLARVEERCPQADFVLLLNADVVLEPDFARFLLEVLEAEPDVAVATGKLLRPGGRVVDSAGISLPRHRRPKDRGSEELDIGQFDRLEEVFGASGAALLLRRSAAADLALDGEVFDEDFFLYYEDTDLCWRAARLGWRVLYEPRARALHTRGWRRERRFEVPVAVRRHSFKNHYLQIVKNERGIDLLRNLPVLVVWELLRLGFVLLRDRSLLPAYGDALRLLRRALHKRRILRRRIRERRTAARSG